MGFCDSCLDPDRAIEAEYAVPIGLVELIDDDGSRKRQLGARMSQDFLPNDLCRQRALRLIGQVVVWKDRLAFRQPLDQYLLEPVDAIPCRR